MTNDEYRKKAQQAVILHEALNEILTNAATELLARGISAFDESEIGDLLLGQKDIAETALNRCEEIESKWFLPDELNSGV